MDAQNTIDPIMYRNIADLSPQELGARGEQRIAEWLQRHGWDILERNWTCPFGEVDIIAHDGLTCVFVEVKTRLVPSLDASVYPEEAVDREKLERYERMAQFYMSQRGVESVRLDVVAVSVVPEGMARVHRSDDVFGRGK